MVRRLQFLNHSTMLIGTRKQTTLRFDMPHTSPGGVGGRYTGEVVEKGVLVSALGDPEPQRPSSVLYPWSVIAEVEYE